MAFGEPEPGSLKANDPSHFAISQQPHQASNHPQATMKVAAVVLASIGVAQAAVIKPLILGGTVVPAGTKTYTVGLRQTATGSDFCGGSLISPTHILTAGHCNGYAQYVAVGSHFLSGEADGERIAVKTETRHPQFDDNTLDHDFNIIELVSPVTTYAPVQLLAADPLTYAGWSSTVMGWGTTSSGGAQSQELLRVDVPILSDDACKAAGLSGNITEAMFCAGGASNQDSCQGDSGGPIILEATTGDLLIGVVSWGDGCGDVGKPGVYGKVSSAKTWIESIVPDVKFV